MALELWREYLGETELVGSFTDAPRRERHFAYAESYLENEHANALSSALPLQEASFSERDYAPFFEGMLPEGPTRNELSLRFQIPQSDYLSLLERLGEECVGALIFRVKDNIAPQPKYSPLQPADFEALKKDGASFMATSMQNSRLSLAGVQSKTGLYLDKNKNPVRADFSDWFRPEGSAPSTHIAKVASGANSLLPVNEALCMKIAAECGLSAAQTCTSEKLPNVVVSRRYDRMWPEKPRLIDGVETPFRLHQEDFCQALNMPSYAKYEIHPDSCYSRMCGYLIRRESSDVMADIRAFALQTALDYLLGNCDSHLKNHSFLYSPTWRTKRLAPVYDLVSTTILGYDHNLGIRIGDHRCIDDVTSEDFALFAQDVGVPARLFKQDCIRAIEQTRATLQECAAAEGNVGIVSSLLLKDADSRLRILGSYANA